MKRKLSSKQKLFINEYLASGNATEAAIKAGYSPKTAGQTGAENLKKPKIKAAIDAKMAEIESRKIADAKEVLEFFSSVLRAEVKEDVAVSSPEGVEIVKLPPNIKMRVAAGKEIIKRYPNSDEMLQAQLTKAQAEAIIKKFEADKLTGKVDDDVKDDDGFIEAISNSLDKTWDGADYER